MARRHSPSGRSLRAAVWSSPPSQAAATISRGPDSPVRRVVARHRQWYYELVRRAFVEAGHERPGSAARHFVMLRDGAMAGGSLDGPAAAKRVFHRGVEGLLKSAGSAAAATPDDDD